MSKVHKLLESILEAGATIYGEVGVLWKKLIKHCLRGSSKDNNLVSFAYTELSENWVLCVNVFWWSFSFEIEGGQTDLNKMGTDLSWPKTFAQGIKQSPNQTLLSVQRKGSEGEGKWGWCLRNKNICLILLFLTRIPVASLSSERLFIQTSQPGYKKSRSQLIRLFTWFLKK